MHILGRMDTLRAGVVACEHSSSNFFSACRLVVIYRVDIAGRNTSSAEMYTNVRFEVKEEAGEASDRKVSHTEMATKLSTTEAARMKLRGHTRIMVNTLIATLSSAR